jgi:hypothetical protein
MIKPDHGNPAAVEPERVNMRGADNHRYDQQRLERDQGHHLSIHANE